MPAVGGPARVASRSDDGEVNAGDPAAAGTAPPAPPPRSVSPSEETRFWSPLPQNIPGIPEFPFTPRKFESRFPAAPPAAERRPTAANERAGVRRYMAAIAGK